MNTLGQQPSGTPSPLTHLRILALPLIAAPVVLVVPTWFITSFDEPAPTWSVALGPLLVVLGFLAAQMVGYPRKPPAQNGPGGPVADPAEIGASSVAAFRAAMFLRFALAEAPLLIAFALAVVVGHPLPYFSAVGLGVLSLIWHVWPSRRTIDRFANEWEQNGRPSYLREALSGR